MNSSIQQIESKFQQMEMTIKKAYVSLERQLSYIQEIKLSQQLIKSTAVEIQSYSRAVIMYQPQLETIIESHRNEIDIIELEKIEMRRDIEDFEKRLRCLRQRMQSIPEWFVSYCCLYYWNKLWVNNYLIYFISSLLKIVFHFYVNPGMHVPYVLPVNARNNIGIIPLRIKHRRSLFMILFVTRHTSCQEKEYTEKDKMAQWFISMFYQSTSTQLLLFYTITKYKNHFHQFEKKKTFTAMVWILKLPSFVIVICCGCFTCR